jgi:hypothetical protein
MFFGKIKSFSDACQHTQRYDSFNIVKRGSGTDFQIFFKARLLLTIIMRLSFFIILL